MSLTKEQLLTPRYVCTGTPGKPLWWKSPFSHGNVINFHKSVDGSFYYSSSKTGSISEDYFKELPHLFRPMPWYDGRELEDMPGYLMFVDDNGVTEFVLKVEKYIIHKKTNKIWAFEYLWENELLSKRMSLDGWVPATEQEYLEYQKQKEW